MNVTIRTADFHFSMPLPVSMAGFVVRRLPDRLFETMRAHTPEPYRALVTKKIVSMVLDECQDILRDNRGLEVVHVESEDGTFVSVIL